MVNITQKITDEILATDTLDDEVSDYTWELIYQHIKIPIQEMMYGPYSTSK